jgi:hypothetical protein
MWSARTSLRFGTGRHVSPSESDEVLPHSKNNGAVAGLPATVANSNDRRILGDFSASSRPGRVLGIVLPGLLEVPR